MKKVLTIALCAILAFGVFSGCAPAPAASPGTDPSPAQQTAQATPAPIASASETPAASQEAAKPADPTPAPTPDPTPEDASPTTGLRGINTTYKPIIVQIENEPPARPQKGIQWADVVYETMIEGIDTRFTCVFNDILWRTDSPEELDVGPVRSSRYYHQWIQGEWDALYVHQGGAETPGLESYIWGPSNDHIKVRINGAGKGAVNADYIYRRKNTGKALEHTAYTELHKDLEVYNYEPAQRQPLKFYPLQDYAERPAIEKIGLAFWSQNNTGADFWAKPGWVEYRYDAASDKLIRYMSGKEFIAEETGKPLEVQNLVVQYVTVYDFPNEQGRKKVDVFGEGPAEFIIHGKHITGSWKRENVANAPTIYYDDKGEEIIFTPGNTWIEMYPNDKQVDVKYADGTEYRTNTDQP